MSQPTVNHHCHREHWRGDNSKVPPYLSFVDQSLVKRILQTIWSGAYIFLLLECIDWRYLFFFLQALFWTGHNVYICVDIFIWLFRERSDTIAILQYIAEGVFFGRPTWPPWVFFPNTHGSTWLTFFETHWLGLLLLAVDWVKTTGFNYFCREN